MNNRNYLLIGFGLTVLLQLMVPLSMILRSEETLIDGTEFRFKTAPVDPTDPFRGKYVTLTYEANRFPVDSTDSWKAGDDVYVAIGNNAEGYAEIVAVASIPVPGQSNYVKAKIARRSSDIITIQYPFDRYYMEESKAGPAERVYREEMRSSSSKAYALVSVYNGNAVIKDVIVGAVSLKELAEWQIMKEEATEEDE